jgi:hypothetical protein
VSNAPSDEQCALCGRYARLTFHHLIPRTLHSNKWFKRRYTREQMNAGIDLCRDCHAAVHKFVDRKELGRVYNTRESLLEHPQVSRFVQWASGRSTTGRVRTKRSRAG